MTASRRALFLYLAFFLSGAAGLIYEIAWLKALGLIFGNTVYAVTTVLAAFMGGLGLGSWALGSRLDRYERPVLAYCYLEIGVGLTALLTFTVLPALREFYSRMGGGTEVRVLCSALLLLPPTFLMGGTFPVLVRIFREGQAETGRPVSRLYALNTAGAVAGTLAAGFLLLPLWGIVRTAVSAAACSALAAILALAVVGVLDDSSSAEVGPEGLPEPSGESLAWVSFASGATAMILEVAWTRLLAVPLGGSTYGFSVMLAAFLIGIAGGSRLYTILARRWTPDRNTLGVLQFGIALAGLLALILWRLVPFLVFALLKSLGATFPGMVAVQFIGALVILLLPALFYGLSFPWLAALYAPGERGAGGRMGRLYGVNTLGAIAGSSLAGFLLVPHLGSYGALAAALVASIAVGVLLLSGSWRLVASAGFAILLAATAAAGLFSHSPLDQEAVVSSFFHGQMYRSNLKLSEIAASRDYVFIEDGQNSTVSVFRLEGQQALRVNGKVDASLGDMKTQVLLGALPLAMHPAPRRVLVIGFGAGVTTRVATMWPGVERVDTVEIEPAVLHAAPYLKALNGEVYRNPRARIILDDARHFLFTTRETYDVVISEPSNPWMAGVGNLFTVEFYREASARLAEGGIFMQWVQGYQFQPDDLALVARTLWVAFPHLSLWRAEASDFLLVASRAPAWPASAQYKSAFERSPELRGMLWQWAGMERPEDLWAYFRAGPEELQGFSGWGQINTDDRPVLEYRAGLRLVDPPDGVLERAVAAARNKPLPVPLSPEERLAVAETLLRIGEVGPSSNLAQPLFKEIPDSTNLWVYAGDWTRAQRNPTIAETYYQKALETGGGPRARAGLALIGLETQRPDAEANLRQALQSFSTDSSPAEERSKTEVMIALAQVLARTNRVEEAIDWQKQVIAAGQPPLYMHWSQLGEFYKLKGDQAAAQQALEKSLALEPYGYAAHRVLGEMYLEAGRNRDAANQFRFLLRFHPASDFSVYERAAEAIRRAGGQREAERVLARGRQIFPQAGRSL